MPPDLILELARAWVAKAQGDLILAELVMTAAGAPAWPIAFHCQQAVEKCIKARLVLWGVKPPVSHNLRALTALADFAAAGFLLSLADLDAPQPFAVAERYPILLAPAVSLEDVAPLVDAARRAMAWIERELAARAEG